MKACRKTLAQQWQLPRLHLPSVRRGLPGHVVRFLYANPAWRNIREPDHNPISRNFLAKNNRPSRIEANQVAE